MPIISQGWQIRLERVRRDGHLDNQSWVTGAFHEKGLAGFTGYPGLGCRIGMGTRAAGFRADNNAAVDARGRCGYRITKFTRSAGGCTGKTRSADGIDIGPLRA